MGCQRTLAARLVCLGTRGCAGSVVPIMGMRCIWSMSAVAWQICVSRSQAFPGAPDYAAVHVATRHVAVVNFLEAGVKRMQEIDPDAGPNIYSARLAGMK